MLLRPPPVAQLFAAIFLLDVFAVVGALVPIFPGLQETAFLWLFVLGPLVGAWGGIEGLHWMATGSLWKLGEPAEGGSGLSGYLRRRWQGIARGSVAAWSPLVLRLFSGACLSWAVLAVVFWAGNRVPPTLPSVVLLITILVQVARLVPLGGAALYLVPLFFALGRRGAREQFHAALALGCSLVGVVVLYALFGEGTWQQFVRQVLQASLYPPGLLYGFMVGATVWWKLQALSEWKSPDRR